MNTVKLIELNFLSGHNKWFKRERENENKVKWKWDKRKNVFI